MSGTVTVIVAPPGFGRAGRMKVGVDGAVVARVRQGASLELTLDPGEHRFRVSGGGFRSKVVTLAVADDGEQQIHAGVHGMVPVAAVFAAAALGALGGLLAVLPVLAIAMAVPGLWFSLRASSASSPTQSVEALEDAAQAAAGFKADEPWWVNDPNLAKRYRKG